ncbi:MAG: Ferredoxin-dependent glutamate synthase (EC [uncultured Sulfurovum sp.]|uniref:Ferredoxin-dependent glutamate synthase (EC) n=1 Tax=uncultured Sulfurovum sp. TaxID=269237 RepID=A0A6S6U0D8_9BACT|nr:MAG: Ferredoxin-dependent glutamate synthase (EC [uncultured Sulfurovum sp.]
MKKRFIQFAFIAPLIILFLTVITPSMAWLFIPYLIITLIGTYDIKQTKHSLWHNYPVLGRFRWVLEELRPPIRQYFIESDIDGVPFNRQTRGLVYRRSKKQMSTIPFGTKVDVYKSGYEWIGHSLNAINAHTLEQSPQVLIGEKNCSQPYLSSVLNISGMSFGALSSNAILALGNGAKIGNFALNTGEGGLSHYHLESGADLIWQIGTGYFGCRNQAGKFCDKTFKEKATLPNVKMIEIKLSQGAKPGHGGILPANKNSAEIAKVRGVQENTQVDSPPRHTAFDNYHELLGFIEKLRQLSNGKPVGFKLAIGQKEEFIELCETMHKTGIRPDFITVDGGEGGTGAAPVEYTNSVGMPLREALVFVTNTLTGFDLKKEIKIIASGRIIDGMDMIKVTALGADLCASARGMMFALGCIQALQCHKNKCPTGIATQNKSLAKALVVEDKKQRVANFHEETLKSFVEIYASAGLSHPDQLNRTHIFYRISQTDYKRYDQLFVPLETGALLKAPYPEGYEHYMGKV